MIEWLDGGVTAPMGFEAAGAAAGIKYHGRMDMALVYSKAPCVTAGTFTRNVVKAAPVLWDRELVEGGTPGHAVIVNSGIANACTGSEGLEACCITAEAAAAALNIPVDSVYIGSTGVIGMQIPTDRITAGIKLLAESKSASQEAGTLASKAIMTTDTVNKEIACRVQLGGKTVTIGGMCKGSGMIHPNMGTMLCYITTDAAVSQALLQKALSEIVEDTFNMISVDGDTSTNDTLLVLANSLAGNACICEENEDYQILHDALYAICLNLCQRMAADGEGASRLIECRVEGADTKEHAKILAKSVICSNLTKAAVFGKDANWGRVLCALGYSGVDFDPQLVDLFFEAGDESLLIFTDGSAADYSEEKATELLSGDKVVIRAVMHQGKESASAWGCDLTYDYVKINADYRS
ncbi:MAG: bifunctional glutamate N-acetyltransferase/amino-acid acetyltransferase ArgJ [Lachnospiraceae bacterium]|nr:bifunctional glutamate N-acetyltransferase/amino-acid acetyltransferase ArgJ [Lachnospiraceae bacterium]